LARFYGGQGASQTLDLTGCPERRLRALTTARFYRLADRRLAFTPSVLGDQRDHLALDMAILCQRLRSEVAYLSRHWQSQGLPTLVLPLGRRHLETETDLLSALLHEWRLGRCGPTAVRLGHLAQFMASADWMTLDPRVGLIPKDGRDRPPAWTPALQHHPDQNLPLSGAEELALELEGERDRTRLIERLKASANIYEQAECLQRLVVLLGAEGEIPWTEAESPVSGESPAQTVRLEALLDQLSQRAAHGRHWSVLRRLAGLRGWYDPGLEEAVTNLLVRQRQILVGRAYSPDSLITEAMGGKAIASRIAQFSREDVRERVLAQEILLSLDSLMKVEPELLRGFLTLRIGYLILLLTAEVSAEFSLHQNEAYEKLLGFSPSEVQSRLSKVLRDYAEATKLVEKQETLHLQPGVQFEWQPQLPSTETTLLSTLTPPSGWLDHRRNGGALGQVPAGFYPEVWRILHHCRGLVIGNKLEQRNRIDSAPILAEMTSGETNFAPIRRAPSG
jgi:phosphorylase kinase alpha/beta subunit